MGAANVVQIITDNGSNFKKTNSNIMRKYEIYWTLYAVYCIDLILKDFRKVKLVEKTIRD